MAEPCTEQGKETLQETGGSVSSNVGLAFSGLAREEHIGPGPVQALLGQLLGVTVPAHTGVFFKGSIISCHNSNIRNLTTFEV